MYNEELKTRFIKSYTVSNSTRQLCESLFNALEKYENEWNADLCTKDAATLANVISDVAGLRKKTQTSILGFFKSYVKWCIDNNVDNACDGALQIKELSEEALKRKMVWSPRELQDYLNAVFESEYELTVDNTYRCFYWLAYSGLSEEDILSVECSDVDLVNMKIRWRGDIIPIYPESLPCFKNCVLLNNFVISRNYITSVPRVGGKILIRGIKGNLSVRVFRSLLSRKISEKYNKSTDVRLTYYRTWLSGLFYKLSMMEQSNILLTDDAILNLVRKNQQLSSKIESTKDTNYKKFLNGIRRDYKNWKKASQI